MADGTTTPDKSKKIHRFQIGLNVIVQIGIVIVLAAMVNYLGFEHYRRWDLSRDKKYQLSDKTKHFLERYLSAFNQDEEQPDISADAA